MALSNLYCAAFTYHIVEKDLVEEEEGGGEEDKTDSEHDYVEYTLPPP